MASTRRTCAVAECETVLSRYNATDRCAVHARGAPPPPVPFAPVKPTRHPPVTLPAALEKAADDLNGRTTADEPVPLLLSEELSRPRGDVAFAAELVARARVLAERAS